MNRSRYVSQLSSLSFSNAPLLHITREGPCDTGIPQLIDVQSRPQRASPPVTEPDLQSRNHRPVIRVKLHSSPYPAVLQQPPPSADTDIIQLLPGMSIVGVPGHPMIFHHCLVG